jgi:hypothetical protein
MGEHSVTMTLSVSLRMELPDQVEADFEMEYGGGMKSIVH